MILPSQDTIDVLSGWFSKTKLKEMKESADAIF